MLRDHLRRRREAVDLGLAVELAPGHACLSARRAGGAVDADPLHRGDIDHQPAVRHRAAGRVVAAAAHRDLQSQRSAEQDRVRHVGHAAAAGDEGGALVDEPVVDPPRLLVTGIARPQKRAQERRRDALDGFIE